MPIRLGGRGVARVPEEEPIIYREMEQGEEEAVCTLVARVFDEFVAPEYEQEGRDEFFRFANPDAMEGRRRSGGFVLVARQAGELVGMLEFILPDHISLLFVSLRQRGVARELMARAVERAKLAVPTLSQLTVNSSSYAEVVYRRMGFLRSGETRTEHGIRYIPMTLFLEGTRYPTPDPTERGGAFAFVGAFRRHRAGRMKNRLASCMCCASPLPAASTTEAGTLLPRHGPVDRMHKGSPGNARRIPAGGRRTPRQPFCRTDAQSRAVEASLNSCNHKLLDEG